jgi:polyphosphate kinase 2 (PPK2 family)
MALKHDREARDGAKAKDGSTNKMKRKDYESELHKLQIRLCTLQDWVKEKGLRVVIVFEGRDAAGKGGTIKALTERVSPRVFRVIALPAPSDREKSQMYIQRYIERFPAAGEIVISIAAGTTERALSTSWDFAATRNTSVSSSFARRLKNS